MIANICDVCGAVILPREKDSLYYLVGLTPVELGVGRPSKKIIREVCPECTERIRKILNLIEVEKNNDRRDEKISISAGSEEDPVD